MDFSKGSNLFVAAVTLIIGAADYTLNLGGFALNGITLGTVGAIVLYQLFGETDRPDDFEFVGDDAIAATERRR